jgi:hypothetical protein
MMRASLRSLALLALSFIGSACSFEAPEAAGALTTNTCSSSEQCTADAVCNGSMCVARTITDSLRVYLHVTPLQQLDGPMPVAVTLPELSVERGSDTHDWTLPSPVRVRGTVRNVTAVVDADVTLTSKPTIVGLPALVVTASVADVAGENAKQYDFDVRVAEPGEYTLRIQPKDSSLPPYEEVLDISPGSGAFVKNVDYAGLVERTIVFSEQTDDRPLVVRAHDLVTGAPLSSTAEVVNKTATLRFMSDPGEFRLVVRPVGAYDPEGLSNADECDHDTPVLPTFSINSSALPVDDDGVLTVQLPPAPERVLFRGRVEVCETRSIEGADEPQRLPITLRSTALTLDDPLGVWTAEVATDTEATREGSSSSFYKYCVDVFQGTYDFVATPPDTKPCDIFAEGNVLVRSADGVKAEGSRAIMQPAAQLLGELRTSDMLPLVATTVDVQSLGRPVSSLGDEDAALTTFSRSRQTTTDAMGAFRVAVDRGSYDVTIKPPSGSGYAWYVRRDVEIGSNGKFTNDVDMSSPVAIDCSIRYLDARDGSVAAAEITAYAVISDAELGERAIAVGKAVADESGQFMLLLPPSVLAGWSQSGVAP